MRHIESQIQKDCVTWFRLQYPKIGRLLFAVPNGGARNAKEAAIMKGEGVTAGVAALPAGFIPFVSSLRPPAKAAGRHPRKRSGKRWPKRTVISTSFAVP